MVPNPQTQSVTIALIKLSGSLSVGWNVVTADAFVAALPMANVYSGLGTLLVRGLISGAVKANMSSLHMIQSSC